MKFVVGKRITSKQTCRDIRIAKLQEATDLYYAMLCRILTTIGGGSHSEYYILVVNRVILKRILSKSVSSARVVLNLLLYCYYCYLLGK